MNYKISIGGYFLILGCLLSGCSFREAVRAAQTPPSIQPMLQPPPPVTTPISAPCENPTHNNSLWQNGAKVFLGDQRGRRIGDHVLVIVDMNEEKATLKYKTQLQEPQQTLTKSLNALGGFENQISKILPKGASPANLINISKNKNHQGDSSINRKEKIKLKISATLVKQLVNGLFVIYGHQQLVVNHERRDVYVSGVLRAQDINEDNTVDYQNIAEARLSYGGQGALTDSQERKAFDRWMSAFCPF